LQLDLSGLERHATRDTGTAHVLGVGGNGFNERYWQARPRSAGSKQHRRSLVQIELHRGHLLTLLVASCCNFIHGQPAGTPAGFSQAMSSPRDQATDFPVNLHVVFLLNLERKIICARATHEREHRVAVKGELARPDPGDGDEILR
jgi:hypothetical protein